MTKIHRYVMMRITTEVERESDMPQVDDLLKRNLGRVLPENCPFAVFNTPGAVMVWVLEHLLGMPAPDLFAAPEPTSADLEAAALNAVDLEAPHGS